MLVSCNKEFWHQLAPDLTVWLHKGPRIFKAISINKLGLIG